MVNYKNKYLEYKMKYINLKNQLEGGSFLLNQNSTRALQAAAAQREAGQQAVAPAQEPEPAEVLEFPDSLNETIAKLNSGVINTIKGPISLCKIKIKDKNIIIFGDKHHELPTSLSGNEIYTIDLIKCLLISNKDECYDFIAETLPRHNVESIFNKKQNPIPRNSSSIAIFETDNEFKNCTHLHKNTLLEQFNREKCKYNNLRLHNIEYRIPLHAHDVVFEEVVRYITKGEGKEWDTLLKSFIAKNPPEQFEILKSELDQLDRQSTAFHNRLGGAVLKLFYERLLTSFVFGNESEFFNILETFYETAEIYTWGARWASKITDEKKIFVELFKLRKKEETKLDQNYIQDLENFKNKFIESTLSSQDTIYADREDSGYKSVIKRYIPRFISYSFIIDYFVLLRMFISFDFSENSGSWFTQSNKLTRGPKKCINQNPKNIILYLGDAHSYNIKQCLKNYFGHNYEEKMDIFVPWSETMSGQSPKQITINFDESPLNNLLEIFN